jgi:hypothetical protein
MRPILLQRSQVTPCCKIAPCQPYELLRLSDSHSAMSPWCLLKRATSSSKVCARFVSRRTCESSAALRSLPSADAVATMREASSSRAARSPSILLICEDSSITVQKGPGHLISSLNERSERLIGPRRRASRRPEGAGRASCPSLPD